MSQGSPLQLSDTYLVNDLGLSTFAFVRNRDFLKAVGTARKLLMDNAR